jgi:hypothetical protein
MSKNKTYIASLHVKKLKQIQNTNVNNALHKRQLYITKQIGPKLSQNNLIITKTHKRKTIVIMNKDTYTQKSRRLP